MQSKQENHIFKTRELFGAIIWLQGASPTFMPMGKAGMIIGYNFDKQRNHVESL